MKKMILFFLVLAAVAYYFLEYKNAAVISPSGKSVENNAPDTSQSPERMALFVPYWTLDEDIQTDADRLIYFGVAADEEGIDKSDDGYKNLPDFVSAAGTDTPTLLTIRLIDDDINKKILKDKNAQQAIINESISLAKKYGFEGIVVDFETSALPFDSIIQRISTFSQSFYAAAKKENLYYATTLYGDTFYRSRAYDVKTIAEHADEIMIMAYDFHKSRGNPGPNFPLAGKETYGYDFKTMMQDFLKESKKAKVTVVFGLFGYDWSVDNRGESTAYGKSLSFNLAKKRFLASCEKKACVVKRDPISEETVVSYQDEEGKKHTVWFEDPVSVEKKKAYLDTLGIHSISFWAYSFF